MAAVNFLSRLFGGERALASTMLDLYFLSRLFGGEQHKLAFRNHSILSKPPVRRGTAVIKANEKYIFSKPPVRRGTGSFLRTSVAIV